MGLHIIIIGNVVDGFEFVGPFKTKDAAHAAASKLWDANTIEDFAIAPLKSEEMINV